MQRMQSIPQKRASYPYCKERSNLSWRRIPSNLMEKNDLQIHGTAMGTKMAVAFANIFMAKVETEIFNQSALKPLV